MEVKIMKHFMILNFRFPLFFSAGKWFLLLCVATLLIGCICRNKTEVKTMPLPANRTTIANPASVYCIDHGGTLSIQKRQDGGEYGICIFGEGRQCEEWAMMRGECPVGGIKVTGYVTPATRYCVITGGTYRITGQSNAEMEQGICISANGNQCDAWDNYNGKCSVTDTISK
jgi:hypothetical protein